MKKSSYLFTALVLIGMTFIYSCSKDDSNTVDQKPAINFVGGAGYVSTDVTLKVNEQFKVGINAFSNTNSGAKLAKFTITRIINNKPAVLLDSAISSNVFNIDILANTNSATGQETWYYKITDKNNESREISLTITTIPGAGPINAYSMKILGAQGSATGSSFASIDGTVYSLAEAKANQVKIDWMYYYGATDIATLAAPNDDHAALVFNNATNGLQTWTTKNATKFKKVTDPIDWASITNDEVIVEQTASGVTNSRITNLATGDILSFIAASGKKGMIKVESITGTEDGSINISVKVQK